MKLVLFVLSSIVSISCSKNVAKKIFDNNKSDDYYLYEEVINDSENFRFLPGDKYSDIKYIKNKSNKWNPSRFYLSKEDLNDNYELSNKNTTYLFSNKNNLITDEEKKVLAQFSQTIPSELINHEFQKYKLVSSYDKFIGMCLEFSKPIYSADKNIAFLDIFLHQNLNETKIDDSTYYEKIGIILIKNNGKWKIAERKMWVML